MLPDFDSNERKSARYIDILGIFIWLFAILIEKENVVTIVRDKYMFSRTQADLNQTKMSKNQKKRQKKKEKKINDALQTDEVRHHIIFPFNNLVK